MIRMVFPRKSNGEIKQNTYLKTSRDGQVCVTVVLAKVAGWQNGEKEFSPDSASYTRLMSVGETTGNNTTVNSGY